MQPGWRRRRHQRQSHGGIHQSDVGSIGSSLDGIPSGGVRHVAYMFARVTGLLLQKVDKIRRTKFAEGDERLGAGIDGLL